jgi:hypothetical protein
MSETTNDRSPSTTDLPDSVELDDVEAHGLREVAAAATIGAAVVGAGGAALAAAHTPVPKTPAIVQQASADAHDLASHAADGSFELAGQLGSDTGRAVRHTGAAADPTADPAGRTAAGAVHGVAAAATGLAQDATQLSVHTASRTVTTASGTERYAVRTAAHEVATVQATTIRVVSATRSIVDHGWDLQLSVVGADASSRGAVLSPTGRITVSDAAGNILARARIRDGVCAVHLTALGENLSVRIEYPGSDDGYAAAFVTWTSPVGF